MNNTVVDHYYISDYDGVVAVVVDVDVFEKAVAVVLDAVAGYTCMKNCIRFLDIHIQILINQMRISNV